MLALDRRRRLLDQVRALGSAQVDDLALALDVSASTVRRDLALLEADGLLMRAHGGAYLHRAGDRPPAVVAAGDDPTHDAKRRIGAAAAARVQDGMTVMILGGSTTAAMLPHLADHSVTVVTNGLHVALALADHRHVDVVLLGGVLHRDQMTLLGPMTEQGMANLHVDVMFAGAFGVHPQVGVTGVKVTQAGTQHLMLQHTEALVVLAEGAKFGRQGPTILAGIDQVDTFVTDQDAPAPMIAELRERGGIVEVC